MTFPFQLNVKIWAQELLSSIPFRSPEWHAQKTPMAPQFDMYELLYRTLRYEIPESTETLRQEVKPNLPWADEHFAERVGGVPLNPPPSHDHWPWAKHNGTHQDANEQFSHTYPERFWPRHAAIPPTIRSQQGKNFMQHWGIRYRYGDLQDVVDLLVRNPLTRQAFLPVWFPEDTGAVSGQRVPCSIGYHFMIRDGRLNVAYTIRSCDLVRHFADDVYMAARLGQWMCEQYNDAYEDHIDESPVGSIKPGMLIMNIHSLHAFVGDAYTLRKMAGHDKTNA